MINQKILLIIDSKSEAVISIMLIIPEGTLFKHATANNIRKWQEAFLIIICEEFPALIDLISLIPFCYSNLLFHIPYSIFSSISTDFNLLSIDLKLVIFDLRFSTNSQPPNIHT